MKISIALLAVASLVAAQDYGSPGSSSSAASAASSSVAASSSAYASSSASSAASSASAAASAPASDAGNAASPSASASGGNGGGNAAQTAPTVNIPTSISSTCSSFLTTLNTASSIQSCLSPLISSLSSSSISSFCSQTSSSGGGCSASNMRTWLTYFKGNCTDELSSNNDVKSMYDTLYVTAPFVDAVCSKDANGNFCVSSSNSGGGSSAQTPLMGSNGMPDANAFSSNDILFLGANPKMTATQLCTSCTQKVMNAYFSFESSTPYASTISQSPLLSSQNALYAAIQKTCPADFLNSALGNVGAGPNGVNGALSSIASLKTVGAVVAVAAGFMAL